MGMLDGANNWQRSNIYAAGKLIGTYDLVTNPSNSAQQIPALHFHLEDALGTRRMQLAGNLPGNAAGLAPLGCPEMDFQELPYATASPPTPTPSAARRPTTPRRSTSPAKNAIPNQATTTSARATTTARWAGLCRPIGAPKLSLYRTPS